MSVQKTAVSKNGAETYAITAKSGMRAEIITYGARIHKLFVPDKNGVLTDVIAGFDDADGYSGDNPYFNAIIGRVANRIGNAEFVLGGKKYSLFANDGKNCLHGGATGFDRRLFEAKIPDENGNSLILTYVSPDGEEGFPGELALSVTYTVTENNALKIRYEACSTEDTPFNPTNHAYFNLDGDFVSVLDHELFIDSRTMTPSDEELICKGEIADVSGTAFDFSVPKTIGRDIKCKNPLLENARGGYDFNYVLKKGRSLSSPAATAVSRKTGIKMDVFTDRPCIQLYTGNFLDGTLKGRDRYGYQSTLCLETQGYPNSINVPSFPSDVLKKGDAFLSETVYAFSVE